MDKHKIRNHLQVIMSFAEFLKCKVENPHDFEFGKKLEYCDIIINTIGAVHTELNIEPDCKHPYRYYCYASKTLKPINNIAGDMYKFNYCPDCGYKLPEENKLCTST